MEGGELPGFQALRVVLPGSIGLLSTATRRDGCLVASTNILRVTSDRVLYRKQPSYHRLGVILQREEL